MNSKYTVPEICKNAVIREGILKELDDTAKKVFFISAGKGSGKIQLQGSQQKVCPINPISLVKQSLLLGKIQ